MVTVASPSSSHRFFRLPLVFDVRLLQADLSLCLDEQWKAHFNTRDYSGNWTGISLRSSSGTSDDILAHDAQGYHDTRLLDSCRYLREAIDRLQCEKETIRLLRLAAGSRINEHRDQGLGYEHGVFRLHVPILTGTGVSFRVDGCDVPMRAGECWYANFSLPHSVTNDSPHDRIHMVIDCRRNGWSDEVFRDAGYDFAYETQTHRPDAATRRQMIEHLSTMTSEGARTLLEQLLREEQEGR